MRRRIRATAALVAIAVASGSLLTWAGAEAAPDRTSPITSAGSPHDPPRIGRQEETGKVGFVGTGIGAPIETGASATDPPGGVAKAFLQRRAAELGLAGRTTGLLVADQRRTPGGGSAVRLTQTHAGIPVLGGEFTVSLDDDRNVLSVLGEASPITTASADPSVGAAVARQAAVQRVVRETGEPAAALATSTPELMFYDPRLLGAPSPFQTARLSWVLEVHGRGPVRDVRHQVVVDAASGTVALSFSTMAESKNRVVCDADNSATQYPCTMPARTEGNPPTAGDDADVRAAFNYAGDTYDFYFARFGRDSLDGAGLQLKSTVDWCPAGGPCPYRNAFWDGSQMVYGDGFASADDVVGHELTHGVTDFTSHLFYYQQSGAINESMSDVFGEYVDLVNGAGTDTAGVRWLVGEDLPGLGAIRDMEDPPAFGDPDRMLSPRYVADPNETDGGGVHSNSGVNNKAAFLITDGGTFNGQTVTGLGVTKAARIYYTVSTAMLVSGSDYADLANALRQACRNLASTGTDGITAVDCGNVDKAVLATEMDQNPPVASTTAASVCPSGTTLTSTVLADDLESNTGQLTTSAITGPSGWYYPQNPNPFLDATYATSGSTNMWGDNPDVVSDSAIRMRDAVPIPAGAFLHFNHAFGFEDDANGAYDGGVVEYSTSGSGGPWRDAGSLFTAPGGAGGYTGTVASGYRNPLAGRLAFVRESNGYGASRADLSSLAGQSVMFRWRIGTDSMYGDYGWFLDDLRIVTCAAPAPPAPPVTPPSPDPPPSTVTPPVPGPGDTTSPQTRITTHPKKRTTARRARFGFRADEGAVFRCKLDKQRWRSCASPKRYERLKPGRHTFRVYAIDAAGNADATPAVWKWRVRR